MTAGRTLTGADMQSSVERLAHKGFDHSSLGSSYEIAMAKDPPPPKKQLSKADMESLVDR